MDRFIELGYFTSVPRANARLRQLFDAGMLRRAFVAEGPVSAKCVYLVGPKAADVVAGELDIDRVDVLRQSRRDVASMFLSHSLASLDLRLAIRRDAERCGVAIEAYLSEGECRHEFDIRSGATVSRVVVKPDAAAVLSYGSSTVAALIECDMAHVSAPQLRRSFLRYAQYVRLGIFRETYGEGECQVLLATSAGARRVENLIALTADIPVPRIRFTTFGMIRDRGFFGPIWECTRKNGHAPLFDPSDGSVGEVRP
jgi:hypothetical protein